METNVSQTLGNGCEWLDIYNPTKEKLNEIAHKYQLHPVQVEDCLQSGHLPKHEVLDNYSFIIFRAHIENEKKIMDTVQKMTHKIAIFYCDRFVITIHPQKQPLIEQLLDKCKLEPFENGQILLNRIISMGLITYQEPLLKLEKEIDYYEEIIFLRPKNVPLLKGLYHLKRKVDLIKRMLELSSDVVDAIDSKKNNVYTRDTRDKFVKINHQSRYLSDITHQLLNVYFSANSQRTNEIMRILTIFSGFFMPLTFIVGVYGMNFQYMPELQWKWAYPAVMLIMFALTVAIFIWFKRKKWL